MKTTLVVDAISEYARIERTRCEREAALLARVTAKLVGHDTLDSEQWGAQAFRKIAHQHLSRWLSTSTEKALFRVLAAPRP